MSLDAEIVVRRFIYAPLLSPRTVEFTGFDDADINHSFLLPAARVCSSRTVAREEKIMCLFEYGICETRVDFSYRSVSNARFSHGLLQFDRN